jgi:hypothetical protein
MRHCTSGKVCYHSRAQAEEELIHIIAIKGDSPGQPNGIYKCDICECYHLTSKSKTPEVTENPEFKDRLRRYRDKLDWENRLGG